MSAAGIREARQARPPDEGQPVLGRHATVVERMPDRGITLRDHQSLHGDNADVFLSSLGAPPFKCRHRPVEVERHRADTKDVYPISHRRRRAAFTP
jgi:hypothetical protein